jgi:hypothetical protein
VIFEHDWEAAYPVLEPIEVLLKRPGDLPTTELLESAALRWSHPYWQPQLQVKQLKGDLDR